MRDPDDKDHFRAMMLGLATSTKGTITSAILKVYWMALQDLSIADYDKAIKRAVGECEFFPSVKELREFAGHGKKAPVPHYLMPADNELERIETCNFHTKTPHAVAPDYVPWCRKCRRARIAANGAGKPQSLGEVMQQYALAPLDKEGERR